MPERWRDELTKLSRAPGLPEAIPERFVRAAPSRAGSGTRSAAIVVSIGIAAAAGFLVIRAFGGDTPGVQRVISSERGRPARDSVEIRCSPQGSTASTPFVRARPDGVHVRIDDGPEGTLFRISGEGTTTALKTERYARRRFTFPLAPGEYLSGCVPGSAHQLAADTSARFRVVDPEHLWLASEPECSDPVVRRIDIGEPRGFDDLDEVVRNGLPGFLPTDVVRAPGYPESSPFPFRVPFVAVQREGSTVANVTSFDLREVIRVCPGTGIAEPEQP